MIAVDWGTSTLRAFRLDARGAVLERREAALGILAVREGRFAEALESQVGDWMAAGHGPVVMSGMIGSRQGWAEQAYLPCPAGPDEIAARMGQVRWGMRGACAWIVPGLVARDAHGLHDVMRGEETQLVGVLETLGPGLHTVCLPGTHSKWATVHHGRITGFTTHMTGELFAVLRDHSILGRLMANAGDDPAAFDLGLARAGLPGGLPHLLFGVRAEGLAGALGAEQAHEVLSGLLIGYEIAHAAPREGTVHLLGAPGLCTRYARALERRSLLARLLDPDAAVRGLHRLAAHLPKGAPPCPD
ncbi:MAG: 2-dehydro-3-deoxygalactonokinase [Betaproteobacteria bacterium]|nr:2-dehydro-3-deoxygalactonokinase [Rhodocyclaceae bacterium]MCA3135254.1 2-dehydro-3-deoxygalactonokinase [Rhodocyclaceae bacterium]MCA3141696.1 2-dehydro-3-deoxygalactonokinase [Rhodocyclaceae bacterium]MCA3145286.1 2-dehydro-3-deoxygalactonokinase [Rhodocyclaceae bacterium]MCE2896840.1 2-dehydro-3-deoxygalactonokinase [Betaproteobacteria bacterium]